MVLYISSHSVADSILIVSVFPESLTDAVDGKGQSSTVVQIKEEEEEEDTNKPPAAKRKRGQSASQTRREVMPKEEIKNEGNWDLLCSPLLPLSSMSPV